MIAAPIVGYYDWAVSNPSSASTGDHFDCEIRSIEITIRVASATIRETSHGEVVTDYFHLLKVGEKWLISSKLWNAE